MKTLIFDLDGTLVTLSPTLTCIADVARLRELRTRYAFALVTGSSKEEVRVALETFDLVSLFDPHLIITADDVAGDKASGAPFFEIRKRIIGDCIMIGDSSGDEIGSNKAGISFVKVLTPELNQRAQLQKTIEDATRILESGN